MAKKVTLEVDVDTTGAVQGIKQVESQLGDVAKKSGEATAKSSKKFSEMAGNILKSLGVLTVLITAFDKIKEALMGTQRGADFFNTLMGSISTVVRDFANFVIDNFGKVVDFFKQVFENPIESIKKLGDLIKENLIERFNSLLDTFGYLGESLSKLFSGDFSGAWESVKKAGKESIDIITGVNNTVDRTVKAVGEAADAVADYAKQVWNQNAALVEAKKQAEISQALANKLKEQKDREAEQLRQIRDEERNTIQDRIKANNDLKAVLDDLEKQSLKLANSKIHEANLQYKLSGLSSDYAKLIQAQADKEGVLAAIAGQRSEQKANDLALNREYNDMLKSQAQNVNELAVNEKKFATEQIFNTSERLKAQREALQIEADLTLKRLQDNIELYKQGTQARVDAENEYNLKKQEIDQNIQLKDKEIREAEIARINEINQIRVGLIRGAEQQATAALEMEYNEKFRLAQGDAEKIVALEEEKQKKLKEIKHTALMGELQMTSDALGALMALNDALPKKTEQQARRSFAINKALQLAQATINGVQSVMTALADPTLVGPARYVAASIAGVTAAANIAKIAQTKFEPNQTSAAGGGGGGNLGSFTQSGGGQPPEGLTAQNNVTQLNPDGTVAGQGMTQQGAMKAYVVESESRAVTERINKLSNNSKIG
jgi:hypothetical protein